MSTIHHNQGTAPRVEAPTSESSTGSIARYTAAAARLSLGWVFLWAFLDKMFGLGHDTVGNASWLNGGSPTKGFLGFATAGPFKGIYHQLAGQWWVDTLFMVGLLAIGSALLLGVAMRFAAGAGALLLVLMWTAVLPPANNPFMDDHLVYALVLVLLAAIGAGHTFGLGERWDALPLVHQKPWLR
ncbi:MAG: hypothetical protein ACR2K3_05995 [Nocardioides sp.]